MLTLLALSMLTADAKKPKTPPPTSEELAEQLMAAALGSNEAYEELVELCDNIGHRLSGSPQLEAAVQWAAKQMREDDLEVRLEEAMVPKWIRGHERAFMLLPREQPFHVLTLGMSVPTPEGGVQAEVIVVDSFDHLEMLGDKVKGKIVLFDVPFAGYGPTVGYRTRGPSEAAKHGAVAALVRSVGPHSLDTPHTGTLVYADNAPKIPAAAVTIETAEQMRRMVENGYTVEVRLDLGPRLEEPVKSHNVLGQVTGREHPNEVIVLGCHLDSWDVGQGAQDDGAGCVVAMEAVNLIAQLPVRPARTIRAVLYTNEENGLGGGKAYAEAHSTETHVALLESDTGAGQPLGFSVDASRGDRESDDEKARTARAEAWIESLQPYAEMLEIIGAGELVVGYSGADIGPTVRSQGSLGMGLRHDMTGYWPVHHTEADTVDKIDPIILRKNVAAFAVMGWMLADDWQLP